MYTYEICLWRNDNKYLLIIITDHYLSCLSSVLILSGEE